MKGKILGCIMGTSKNGNAKWSVTVDPERTGENVFGTNCYVYTCMDTSIDIPSLIGKICFIDTDKNFANAFYEVDNVRG